MNRRGRLDAVVVGGGVVGTACALGMADAGLDVVLVEAAEPAQWSPGHPDLRVYAFAPDNAMLLDALGVWKDVLRQRVQPYRRMRVWDAAVGGALEFSADGFARPELGWIVEHGLLVDRLWQRAQQRGVVLRCPARVVTLDQDEDGVRIGLDDGSTLDARVVIAADGAQSALRELTGVASDEHDYDQLGLVAYVRSERPHDDTAFQRFLPGGPLALLPCPQGRSSIVWTLPADEARRLLDADVVAFNHELARASDGCLGALELDSVRATFPLRRKLARTQLAGRTLLMGDAAHVVHPLAGQGVNLGLRDVSAWLRSVRDAAAKGRDFDALSRLQRWARERRSDNTVSTLAFEAINRIYSNDQPAATLLRGHALDIAGRLPMLRHALWRHAAGL
ncbi:FAD-dependent monooxygenase [Solilutibacter silvestris]|uniref:Ubi-OHase: ubiquinone biosynthesis hydroxylase, UbiH/UbiF/VisC/COQ6 family n=1 Tax=Solilutibacter silvestris TaxID=1645665 RepID=A0A2K1PXK3_9GAMM|nr:FAD-dependent monooxygenase [Lysobacter silvestris]PNS07515.1 Ubi-OHase: ubiquinone biosynthesis hydroxylase, UbiH/UbiF/VisC/COQ6 family [Lysobacter silvestris]